ncbi:Separin [Madurella mycetomatis]|uniref:Separin n=1 Tax=Madurella mycetomatis TaxID=100816 RepID=A0A175WDD2_9PEZI|nr:Separin [Madurella mycetomatis]
MMRKRVIFLRQSGQYDAALAVLSNLPGTDDWVLCERAFCHFMLHQFEQVTHDYTQLAARESSRGSKEEALTIAAYDLSRVHTDLALQEAVETAQDTYAAWLADKPLESFDDQDLSLLFFCHTILCLGCHFLCESTADAEERIASLPSLLLLDGLRARFLHERQVGHLAMIHLAEAVSNPPDIQISRIGQTIDIISADHPDLQVHLGVLLAKAYFGQGETQQVVQELMQIHAPPYISRNPEAQWWAELYMLRVGRYDGDGLETVERLLQGCRERGARNGMLVAEFLEAEMHLNRGDEERYSERIRDLSLRSHEYQMPPRSILLVNGGEPRASWQPHKPPYSSFEFWLKYLDLIDGDMNSRTRLGLALSCPTRFFERHSKCSMPGLKFTLASSLAESYKECSDTNAALHWTAQLKVFAEEANDQGLKDEARFLMGFLMSGDSIRVAADPDQIQLAGWRAAQRLDLENLYEEARQKNLVEFQLRSAELRLDKELADERMMNKTPRGEVWLGRTLAALEHLSEPERVFRYQQIKYKMAHAKFDYGDYKGAADVLAEVVEMSENRDSNQLLYQALFTKARAHLHEYMVSGSSESWNLCLAALERSLVHSKCRNRIDEIACCHILAAVAWDALGSKSDDDAVLDTALYHISEVRKLWDEEARGMASLTGPGLDSLLSKYSLRGRNESIPYSALGLAIDICFRTGQFEEAWMWAEYAKARVFAGEPRRDGFDPDASMLPVPLAPEDAVEIPNFVDSPVIIHWAFVGDTVYMISCRERTRFRMFKLGITTSAVEQWYQDLVATKEDFRSVDTAEELLSELSELCAPLFDPDVANPDELLIFCPTGVLFKIPLHAIMIEGVAVLERNPIVYTYSSAVLGRCLQPTASPREGSLAGFVFLGNPTGDTPAGGQSVEELAVRLGGRCYSRSEATKGRFCSSLSMSRLVHFHGHVNANHHPQQNAMVFAGGCQLKTREVFDMDCHQHRPAVVLIGCGSGTERLNTGDEPVGFISAFLHAGASMVIATLWPINDKLSGAAFSDMFYEMDAVEGRDGSPIVDLARRLRMAALSIKAQENTAAPYFWAGFVLHGKWWLVLK